MANENGNNDIDKPPSKPKKRTQSSSQKEKKDVEIAGDGNDKQPTKPKRKIRVSPESETNKTSSTRTIEDDHAVAVDEHAVTVTVDELGLSTFHTLRIDSDKPGLSRASSSRRRDTAGASSGKPTRRRPKESNKTVASVSSEDSLPAEQQQQSVVDAEIPNTNTSGAGSSASSTTRAVDSKEKGSGTGSTQLQRGTNLRVRRERRKDRERPLSNTTTTSSSTGVRDSSENIVTNTPKRTSSTRVSGRSSLRSQSERWNKAVESLEDEGGTGIGTENARSIRRRASESLNRANDGLSRSKSTHSKIRRHHSSGIHKVSRSLSSRSYHGVENDTHRTARTPTDGRTRTPRRSLRRHHKVPSAGSLDESIEDFKEFEEDAADVAAYGMALQTPGMANFEEEMLDLMQRANPEVTDHLDRRVHRKREMVAFDRNMPMMTRQALLTRQASSQIQRQYFDGSNIDKNRLLLRNDSMSSTDGLGLSSHRTMRGTHGTRAPPRAKSSGLGGIGYNTGDSLHSNSVSDDRRHVFRSRSSHGGQPASFNQYYQNKQNKAAQGSSAAGTGGGGVSSRRAPGDLIKSHSMRGSSRSSDHVPRRRTLQGTNSSSASYRRRSSSSDHVAAAPRKPVRKKSKGKRQPKSSAAEISSRHSHSSHSSDRETTNLSSEDEKLGSSPKKSPNSPYKSSSLNGISKHFKDVDKNDMSNKRNRSKLHLLMYKTKMSVDVDLLFRKVRQGENPRSPIDSLRMPSP